MKGPSPALSSEAGSKGGLEGRGVEAARNLDALAWLQFCRLRLGLYSRLLQDLLAAVMDSPAVSLPVQPTPKLLGQRVL